VNTLYSQLVAKIISAQEAIVGPVAKEIAGKVTGIDNPNKQVLENLVKEYSGLFGQASIETCKDAIKDIVNPSVDLPEILKS
jgi:hypothetical protein